MTFKFESSDGWEMRGSRIWWRVLEWAYWALAITVCRHCSVSWAQWSEWYHDDQWSGDCFLCDMGWCLPASDPASCSAHHLRPGKWMVGERWKVVFRVYTVYSVHQTWSMAGSPWFPVFTHWHSLTSPALRHSADIMSAPLCRLTMLQCPLLQCPEAVNSVYLLCDSLYSKVYSVSVNKS